MDDAKIEVAQFILSCLRISPEYVAAVMKPPCDVAPVTSPVYPVSAMQGVPLTAGWPGLSYPAQAPSVFYPRITYAEPFNYAAIVSSMYGMNLG